MCLCVVVQSVCRPRNGFFHLGHIVLASQTINLHIPLAIKLAKLQHFAKCIPSPSNALTRRLATDCLFCPIANNAPSSKTRGQWPRAVWICVLLFAYLGPALQLVIMFCGPPQTSQNYSIAPPARWVHLSTHSPSVLPRSRPKASENGRGSHCLVLRHQVYATHQTQQYDSPHLQAKSLHVCALGNFSFSLSTVVPFPVPDNPCNVMTHPWLHRSQDESAWHQKRQPLRRPIPPKQGQSEQPLEGPSPNAAMISSATLSASGDTIGQKHLAHANLVAKGLLHP